MHDVAKKRVLDSSASIVVDKTIHLGHLFWGQDSVYAQQTTLRLGEIDICTVVYTGGRLSRFLLSNCARNQSILVVLLETNTPKVGSAASYFRIAQKINQYLL